MSLLKRPAMLFALCTVAWCLAGSARALPPWPMPPRASSEYLVRGWETDQGLPENSATAMVQTFDGYLWFGTFSGLVRFNSVDFKVMGSSTAPDQPGMSVVNVHIDIQGHLWVSDEKGLAWLEKGRWHRIGPEQGWSGTFAKSFAENRSGDLYVGTLDGKLFHIVGGKAIQVPLPPARAVAAAFCLFDSEGVLWVTTQEFCGRRVGEEWIKGFDAMPSATFSAAAPSRSGGMWLLDGSSLRHTAAGRETRRFEIPQSLRPMRPWSLFEDSRSNLWVSSHMNGVYRFDPAGRVSHFTRTNGLTHNSARFVFEDRERNLWVGTSGGGLMQFKPRLFTPIGADSGLPEPVVNSICEPVPGNYLIGTFGSGVVRFGEGLVSKYANGSPIAPDPYIGSMVKDRRGRVWVGTLGNGVFILENDQVKHIPTQTVGADAIRFLFQDSHDAMWVGGNKKLSCFEGDIVRAVGAADGLTSQNIRCMGEDVQRGLLWVGTYDKGLFRMENGRFKNLSKADGLITDQIRDIKVDADGTVWIATYHQGLVRYRDGRFTNIGEAQGLPVMNITTILEDRNGCFWFGSSRGILRVTRKNLEAVADGREQRLQCNLFDLSDGLASIECATGYQPSSLCDSRGRLWFSTVKGAVTVDPRDVVIHSAPTPVHIEEIIYLTPTEKAAAPDKHEASDALEDTHRLFPPFPDTIQIPAGSLGIEIHYAGMDFAASEKIKYQIMLQGRDPGWVDMNHRRAAYYHDLPPGNYYFRVRAANRDGTWTGNGTPLLLYQEPFFWQTAWCRLLALLAFAGGIGGSVWRIQAVKIADQKERLEQQQTLARERARASALTETTSDLVCFVDSEGRFLSLNAAGRKMLGLSPDANISEKAAHQFVDPDSLGQFNARGLHELLASGHWSGETTLRSRDGKSIPFQAVVQLHRLPDGAVDFYSAIARNLSEQKAAENALRESEQRYHALVDNLGDMLFVCETDPSGMPGRILDANESVVLRLGYSRQELLQMRVSQIDAPETLVRIPAVMEELASKKHVLWEGVHVTKSGRRVPVEINAHQIELSGKPVILSTARDISERKRADEELRLSQARMKAILDNSPDMVWLKDRELRFLAANEAFLQEMNCTLEEISGQTDARLLPGNVAEEFEKSDQEVLRTGKSKRIVLAEHDKAGRMVWVETIKSPARNERGEVIGIACIARDITERKRTEDALRFTQFTIEHSSDAAFWMNTEGRLIYVNEAACRLLEYSRYELLNLSMPSICPNLTPETWPAHWLEIKQRKSFTMESKFKAKSGRVFPIESHANYVEFEGKEYNCAFVRDITVQRQLEDQFRQAQKMEAVGHLAGGIAHDFNNLLTVIQGHTEFLLDDDTLPKNATDSIREVYAASERAANLTRQLLAFGRRQMLQVKRMDLNLVVNEVTRMLRRLVGEHITLQLIYHPDEIWIDADAVMISQIIMNLAVNARDAMPKGGQLSIQTAVVEFESETNKHCHDLDPGRYGCLIVADTGMGMDEKTRSRLFEPFFTTKEMGKGTGLGLATVYGIVKQHKGGIEVISQPQQGSTFKIYFPLRSKPDKFNVAIQAINKVVGGKETILVVEDEPAVRQLAVRSLSNHGYQVLQAESGVQALSVWQQSQKTIDLVLTDMVMPEGLSGKELIERLRQDQPALKAIYSSGYSIDAISGGLDLRDGYNYLPKPYDPNKLLTIVRKYLDEK